MNRFLASRGFMSVLAVVILCLILLMAYLTLIAPPKKMRSNCANMPDTIGLYTGNHVTVRGVTVGTVTRIEPRGDSVYVAFDVEADHPLHGDLAATTVSDTIVADRSLALIDDSDAAAEWDSHRCVSRTMTPKSMTQTLDAVGKLSSELSNGNAPGQQGQLSDEISALDTALSGTGPEMNDTIMRLGRALDSPNAAIGHIGALTDSMRSLTDSVAGGWGDIESMITRLAPGLSVIDHGIFQRTVSIIDSLRTIVPWLNELTTMFGEPILQVLDATVPLARLAGANVGSLKDIVDMTPPLVQAFRDVLDPNSGKHVLTYASPRVALPQPDAEKVCAAVGVLVPGRCDSAVDGLTNLSLAGVVLGAAGAQR